ncbi:hypothetical protein scyTo_0023378, partial [Scyliorhinus torazame]|nr:hypothetical protein [Scyliorhinus torazame]
QDCLDDVRRAQELGYPPELEHKILARRTSCLHHLGILEGASNSQTRGSLSGGDGQSSAATALSSIEPFSKSCGTPSSQREASTVPWEVSPAIVLHSDALRGRHFVATEELKPGEVVLQEEAFAAVLIPEGRGRQSGPNEDLYCHHCLGQAELPLPCLSCSFSSYCRGGNSHVAEMEQVRIATAFYSAVSLLNHSCQPNTSITFHNTTMTVRASQRIPATQEVLHCYGPHWSRMALKERQQALSLQYFFQCLCTACVSEEKEEAGMGSPVTQFLCSQCGLSLQVSRA